MRLGFERPAADQRSAAEGIGRCCVFRRRRRGAADSRVSLPASVSAGVSASRPDQIWLRPSEIGADADLTTLIAVSVQIDASFDSLNRFMGRGSDASCAWP